MIHVGMDVHVRNSVLNAKDADGQALARGRCGNTLLEISGLLAPIERRVKQTGEKIRVVMESTTNSRAMQRLLTQYGREAGIDLTAEVLHARKLRIIAESVNRCDRVDTNILTELSRSNLKLPTPAVDEVVREASTFAVLDLPTPCAVCGGNGTVEIPSAFVQCRLCQRAVGRDPYLPTPCRKCAGLGWRPP